MDESQILAIVERIEAHLGAHVPEADMQQAIEDVFNAYGQLAQMREVIAQLVEIVRAHDSNSARERSDIYELLIQLRELSRKQVAGLADVERAVAGGHEAWNGEERRTSIPDRRRRAG